MVPERWQEKCRLGIDILEMSGVEVLLFEGKVLNEGEFTISFNGVKIEP
jgi:hypothetical protein